MVITDAIGGVIDSCLGFHYDIGNDVLYIRRLDAGDRETYSEDAPEGLSLRDEATDDLIGWTSVNWRKRHALGAMPDSIADLTAEIANWAAARSL